MFYGDYHHELAKERMRTAVEEREHANLAKQARSADRGLRGGMVARGATFVVSLFR